MAPVLLYASLYRLTSAETRLATMLAAGCKTHAKRIYEKMGLKSHGEVAQLFGRLAVPISPLPAR
jgi:hypothetical protein